MAIARARISLREDAIVGKEQNSNGFYNAVNDFFLYLQDYNQLWAKIQACVKTDEVGFQVSYCVCYLSSA